MTAAVIAWSGGLDSTAALVKILRDTDWEVTTLYVDLDNNWSKSRCEERAIKALKPVLEKTYRGFTHLVNESKIEAHNGFGFRQPPVWLLHAIYSAASLTDNHKDVRIVLGWIRGDEVIGILDQIRCMVDNIWNIMCDQRPVPVIELPLIRSTKHNSVRMLRSEEKRHAISICSHMWTCEHPHHIQSPVMSGYVMCGLCTPCKRAGKIGLYDMKDFEEIAKIVGYDTSQYSLSEISFPSIAKESIDIAVSVP